jgi:hypothetical protein
MRGFPSIFLIFFFQLAWGGLLGLAATPFHELDRAFYKSTAAVLFVIAFLGAWGQTSFQYGNVSIDRQPVALAQMVFQWLFVAAFAGYLISLWTERQFFRARSFAAAVLCGLIAVILSAHGFYEARFFSVETAIYPAGFLLSSLLLGSVTVGMLIGHWYLIDTGQSLEPVNRIFKYFVFVLIAQGVFFLVFPALLYFIGSKGSSEALERLWNAHLMLFTMRILAGQIAPLVLSWMIWRTLLIPHTMAATGLFYIALLGVFIGDILGKQILALTGLPF